MLKKLQTGVDTVTTAISGTMIAIMFLVIMANVVLRLIPQIGGFAWYMEFSQYANVWAMLIGAVGIVVQGTNLRVEIIDSLVERFPWGYKLTRIIVDLSVLAFYVILTHSGYLLATKAKQTVSTMPAFTMGQVYWIFPVAGVLCIAAALLHLVVTLREPSEKKGGDEE